MGRRVVSLWLPRLATERLGRRRVATSPASRPAPARTLATISARQGGVRIVAVNGAAEAAGVAPGMTLANARAVAPGLATTEADPAGERRTLAAIAVWCGRYTPWTAADGGGVWLDITGCAHLFGGETGLLEDLKGRLKSQGFAALAAAADTPGAAWAVARFSAHGGNAMVIIPSGKEETRTALASLPVAGLRLAPAAAEGLGRVGLRRIGDLFELPRAPLAKRFGEVLTRRLDEALGTVEEPILPHRSPSPVRARLAFANPIKHGPAIAGAARHLLAELCRRLEAAHQGVRRLELTLYHTDGSRDRTAIGTSRPMRDAAHLEHLFRDKLEGLDPGFGIEVMVLAAAAVDPLPPTQSGLRVFGRGTADGVSRLIDRLANRLGAAGVVRLHAPPSHLPERACRALSAAHTMNPAASMEDRPVQPRPLHLLLWPESINVIAPTPDDPPAVFHWRRARYRVARAEGPERIAPEWWREAPEDAPAAERRVHDYSRDYFRVEDTQGQRFWLYREGLYRPDRAPRWYMHGLFA